MGAAQVEWLELSSPRNRYRVLGSSALGPDRAVDDAMLSVQKLGIVVWAKSGAHPWWPAELCLPAATKFLDALPPPRPGGRVNRQQMVIYFGDAQFDILDAAAVVPFASRPKPVGKGAKDVLEAYALAQERLRELKKKA